MYHFLYCQNKLLSYFSFFQLTTREHLKSIFPFVVALCGICRHAPATNVPHMPAASASGDLAEAAAEWAWTGDTAVAADVVDDRECQGLPDCQVD